MSNSLLQDVLTRQGAEAGTGATDELARKLQGLNVPKDAPRLGQEFKDDSATSESDDELIPVVSAPGTPRRLDSRATSRSTSPTRSGAASRRVKTSPLHLSSSTGPKKPKSKTDPIRVLPTDLVQRIFVQLETRDLARCSRVCLKWNKSQSLNYIWFRQLRKLEFHDESLPTGKWTRKESKENWRKQFMKTAREFAETDITSQSRYGYATPPAQVSSGYSTPKEVREARWAEESETSSTKTEAREAYKELGGRKARSKNKVGSEGGARDRGGWTAAGDDEY